ncbi:LysR family transcriptional regulator [Sphingobium chlorophenolicum]|uniref:Transcriptional regulator, LysR family n=1 Tax=Sphingobium chlorophenolicum TaxID=46429 RepID=A0A081RGE4_SPHCR|nr:LysR family transcriptional regulator [Sphingobium chlorophenolicum]KEQ54267.1 Transcriptional regulator, LysR family [Sphingobium chlorophenolicum]
MATPSLRQLDIFAQMVASGSLSHCARELGVTADDVARDLASLELRLGYRLFDDLAGDAHLTAAGRKTAQAMTLLSQDRPDNWQVDQADDIAPPPPDAALQPAARPARETIVLAAPAPVFGHFQEALAAFEAANDDIAITLDLTIHLADEAAWALHRGKADIAYFYALGETDDLPSRYGWSEQINLYAGTDHPLARRESVAMTELAAMPTLAMEPRNGLRLIIDEALMRGGVRLGDPVLETDNLFDIVTILREGAGCFAAFGPLARDLGRMTGIRRIALERPLPAIEVRQAVHPQSPAAAGALAEFLFL